MQDAINFRENIDRGVLLSPDFPAHFSIFESFYRKRKTRSGSARLFKIFPFTECFFKKNNRGYRIFSNPCANYRDIACLTIGKGQVGNTSRVAVPQVEYTIAVYAYGVNATSRPVTDYRDIPRLTIREGQVSNTICITVPEVEHAIAVNTYGVYTISIPIANYRDITGYIAITKGQIGNTSSVAVPQVEYTIAVYAYGVNTISVPVTNYRDIPHLTIGEGQISNTSSVAVPKVEYPLAEYADSVGGSGDDRIYQGLSGILINYQRAAIHCFKI
jgi:hypothetical protein